MLATRAAPIRSKGGAGGGAGGGGWLKGGPGRGTLAKEKPPIFGMIERGGEVRIIMLENGQQSTIRPLIQETIEPGTIINTDE